ncbi:endonuclease [Skermanella stibiiresistens SB22]|uniref:Endonuclease n=1 Tax=Skermanella stibiiresistens SB22 TaxID=1385369 RepID=W9GRS8_9PROT|nr:HNH endonuclease [Skermanella stibiiresistens]EWY36489.1 endonuclease [Skermanella stibiiresistens SB22]
MRIGDPNLLAISQRGRCFYCGEVVGAKATVDHFIPQCYGGIDDIANTVLAHRRCNIDKGDRLPTPDEIERLIEIRRHARLPVWPPILALRDAEDGEEWIVVARAVAALRPSQ